MKKVISCSRRTDIPMHYYGWLQKVLSNGSIELKNYFSQEMYTVDLSPDLVHSIVLWSKDYRLFVIDPGLLDNYNLYFQFTITGYPPNLEPGVPSIYETCEQMRRIADRYSPEQINWRFDPIIISKGLEHLFDDDVFTPRYRAFEKIAKVAQKCGIKRCTISFIDLYGKVKKVFESRNITISNSLKNDYSEKIVFSGDNELNKMFAEGLIQIANMYGIQLYSCSQPFLEDIDGIKKSNCIDGTLLGELFGDKASIAKDASQRKSCGCTKSTDIGSYQQPCPNKCLYCYANAPTFTLEK